MRENQRGGLDHISSGIQKGSNKNENAAEGVRQENKVSPNVTSDLNRTISEGMTYIDIIPRFAL